MEKVVIVPVRVEDLTGLLIDLKKAEFLARNVGADANCTYVYLEQEEEKDPCSLVESWVGRKAPDISDQKELKKRSAELKALATGGPSASVEGKESLFRRLFRKFVG